MDFVETYMPLPPRERMEFTRLVTVKPEYREVKKMITVYEKDALKRGLQEGRRAGKVEGKAEGRAEGECIGRIRLSERLLGRAVTPTEKLARRPLTALRRRAAALEGKIRL